MIFCRIGLSAGFCYRAAAHLVGSSNDQLEVKKVFDRCKR
jgi:hypothetical protein